MNYKDFVIEFDSPNEDGLFPVRITRSPVGEAQGLVRLPFTLDEVGDDFTRLIKGENLADFPWSPERVGPALFSALFQDDVLKCYRDSLAQAEGGLRIKIQVRSSKKGLDQIHRLPWEFMMDPENPVPLALQPRKPLVRYLPRGREKTGLSGISPLPSPLRILVVTPNPTDGKCSPIPVEKVQKAFDDGFGGSKEVLIDYLETGTLVALRTKLEENHYHILHITAHGVFCKQEDRGFIVFEGEPSHLVDGRLLATVCQAAGPHLRLVSLISCESGKMGADEINNPWGGLAPTLAASGIPAVLAMQFQVSYGRAFAFTSDLYKRIIKGISVDRAINETRVSILIDRKVGVEWGTPVLFMSTESGDLFSQNQRININAVYEQSDVEEGCLNLELAEYFAGSGLKSPFTKHQEDWNEKILPLLRKLPDFTRSSLPLTFSGHSRLSIWFAVGFIFNKNSHFILEAEQKNQANGPKLPKVEYWRSDYQASNLLNFQKESGKAGADCFCVSVSISREVHTDAQKHFHNNKKDFESWLIFKPKTGAGDGAIAGNGEALEMAEQIGSIIKAEFGSTSARTIHLFISAPGAFAMFLGRQLNACGQIQLYEFSGGLYQESFLLK